MYERTDFNNGYGVSVINDPDDPFDPEALEIALTHYGELCYSIPSFEHCTRRTTLGNLLIDLADIVVLVEDPMCDHRRPYAF